MDRRIATRLRDASSADLPRIVEIERLSFPSPWSLSSFRRELALAFSRLTVATIQSDFGEKIGGFLCRWIVADECHILNIAVHPESRRRGLATTLMTAAISEAQEKGSRLVTLEVRRSNLAARRLYRKFGFEERRLRRNYYGAGQDALVMELSVGLEPHVPD